MQFVKQIGNSDCFSACLASMLELPLGAVPDFFMRKTAAEFYASAQRWLARLGYTLLIVPMDKTKARRPKWSRMHICTPAIFIVKRNSYDSHAIIGTVEQLKLRVLFDPDPGVDSSDEKYEIQYVVFLVPGVKPGTKPRDLRLLK